MIQIARQIMEMSPDGGINDPYAALQSQLEGLMRQELHYHYAVILRWPVAVVLVVLIVAITGYKLIRFAFDDNVHHCYVVKPSEPYDEPESDNQES